VLWSPQATAPQATVLVFHGGSGHKRSERHLQMGRRLASEGLAAVAVDGPYHGDRVTAPMAPSVCQRLIADEGIERVTGRITADWLQAISALAGLGLRRRRARQRLRDVDGRGSGSRPQPRSGPACSAR